MVCDFEEEETTLAGDEGLGWEAGNLDGKVVDLSFRELKNFEIVSVRHVTQFVEAGESPKVYDSLRLENQVCNQITH